MSKVFEIGVNRRRGQSSLAFGVAGNRLSFTVRRR